MTSNQPLTMPYGEQESRVQAAFLLWFLYRQHSLDMNPFQVAFQEALQANQTHVTIGQKRDSLSSPKPSSLVLTLEMLLSGRGYQAGLCYNKFLSSNKALYSSLHIRQKC